MAAGRLRYWSPVLFFMGYIFFMSSRAGSDIPCIFARQDIVYHFCIYALLGWSFARALFFEMPRAGMLKIVCVCAVFGLLYGVSDEYHQSFVSGRSSEIFDIVIDTAGSLFGGILVRWLR
ncbi:MAG TPA: VanZ family protein [Candidatus Omnitrophota bacterium]|nr:VanZ family protein [Candidatus Omnitrophota bacterium]HNQ50197.1 VanZ family protein [Candidatus Omnitrophota bacterium]